MFEMLKALSPQKKQAPTNDSLAQRLSYDKPVKKKMSAKEVYDPLLSGSRGGDPIGATREIMDTDVGGGPQRKTDMGIEQMLELGDEIHADRRAEGRLGEQPRFGMSVGEQEAELTDAQDRPTRTGYNPALEQSRHLTNEIQTGMQALTELPVGPDGQPMSEGEKAIHDTGRFQEAVKDLPPQKKADVTNAAVAATQKDQRSEVGGLLKKISKSSADPNSPITTGMDDIDDPGVDPASVAMEAEMDQEQTRGPASSGFGDFLAREGKDLLGAVPDLAKRYMPAIVGAMGGDAATGGDLTVENIKKLDKQAREDELFDREQAAKIAAAKAKGASNAEIKKMLQDEKYALRAKEAEEKYGFKGADTRFKEGEKMRRLGVKEGGKGYRQEVTGEQKMEQIFGKGAVKGRNEQEKLATKHINKMKEKNLDFMNKRGLKIFDVKMPDGTTRKMDYATYQNFPGTPPEIMTSGMSYQDKVAFEGIKQANKKEMAKLKGDIQKETMAARGTGKAAKFAKEGRKRYEKRTDELYKKSDGIQSAASMIETKTGIGQLAGTLTFAKQFDGRLTEEDVRRYTMGLGLPGWFKGMASQHLKGKLDSKFIKDMGKTMMAATQQTRKSMQGHLREESLRQLEVSGGSYADHARKLDPTNFRRMQEQANRIAKSKKKTAPVIGKRYGGKYGGKMFTGGDYRKKSNWY